jgi:hypothetical protein
MKQVVVQAYCDLCAAEDGEPEEPVPAVAEETFGGRLLDLCTRHQQVVQRQIRRLEEMFAYGSEVDPPTGSKVRPSRQRSPSGPGGRPANPLVQSVEWRTCPECGHVSPTRSGLGQHTRSHHEKGLNAYDWPT